ncbi:MAG: FtsQ-type POTRA domain-containing protein [Ardenticatenales bacterium]|nr:FtsQ-type POTRA domain-containing protein [Ardenticatenales bacterium]
MTPPKRGRLQRFSQQLTFGKISLGPSRRARRSRRLKLYEEQAAGEGESSVTLLEAFKRWWVRVVSFLLVVVLLYLAFGTSWFYIYDADVVGARLLSKEELYHRSNLEAWSIFWLNPQVVAQRIEEEPIVAHAEVSAMLPNVVTIRVQERVPLAVWQTGDQSLYVDGEGVLFGLRGDASQMLVIRDMRDAPVESGQHVDEVVVRTAWELSQIIPERRAFDWEPGVGLSFVTDEGWRVTFGDHTRLAAKVAAYHAFKAQIKSETKILLLDLSVPEHPYYRVSP